MHVGPVIAVSNLARARTFDEEQLGLRGEDTPGGRVLYADQGTQIYLLPDVPEAGTATWPVASFRVDDLRGTVCALRSLGVPSLGPQDLPFKLDDDKDLHGHLGGRGGTDARPGRFGSYPFRRVLTPAPVLRSRGRG